MRGTSIEPPSRLATVEQTTRPNVVAWTLERRPPARGATDATDSPDRPDDLRKFMMGTRLEPDAGEDACPSIIERVTPDGFDPGREAACGRSAPSGLPDKLDDRIGARRRIVVRPWRLSLQCRRRARTSQGAVDSVVAGRVRRNAGRASADGRDRAAARCNGAKSLDKARDRPDVGEGSGYSRCSVRRKTLREETAPPHVSSVRKLGMVRARRIPAWLTRSHT